MMPALLSPDMIEDAARRAVAAATDPVRVILFGSYARGDAGKDSDLDLLVIERGGQDKATEYLRIQEALGSMNADVIVQSEEEFDRRSQVRSSLSYWARKEGKVLYDAAA